MSTVTNKKIAIVGGGPGGLTLARLLQQKGADVHVYERDLNRDARVQGATLDLHEESGLMALQAAGLMDAFVTNHRPGADRVRIVDADATIHLDDHTNENKDASRPEIDRGPLRDILLDSLLPGTVVWNSHLMDMKPLGDGWQINFQNDTSAVADLVIAADGANSKLRPLVTSIRPFYSGVTIVEGTVYNSAINAPAVHELLKGGKIFAISDEKTIIVSSKGDGSLVFYTGCKTDEDWVGSSSIDFSHKAQVRTWFEQMFGDWNPIWLELIDGATTPFTPRPQYCMPLDQQWESLPNLTMLGDAAHLMPPYAGEGVNMAMLDALELSRCLTDENFTSTKMAIAAYEQQMLLRFADIGGITLQQTASLHSADGLMNMLLLVTA
ncbi:FAD-dependent oxidoreductase [Spirosoma sp. KUDC1026]|uniref:FAD-dependent oxidoreductase n=1 Tax=Spirosoma sp. KUDC1026 TaxID=2745947 RepID=UPI00159B94CF|nr:NAD(P)/FAD-dependent oxidoreductase [Spirosoma sp. KUDC1026]QKZ14892.1 FAD-dependent monooxygenase [Spirosoma sp. KUDC1026]